VLSPTYFVEMIKQTEAIMVKELILDQGMWTNVRAYSDSIWICSHVANSICIFRATEWEVGESISVEYSTIFNWDPYS